MPTESAPTAGADPIPPAEADEQDAADDEGFGATLLDAGSYLLLYGPGLCRRRLMSIDTPTCQAVPDIAIRS